MAVEMFVASICSELRIANTTTAKDIGVYIQTLQPIHGVQSTFKKSSTQPNCMDVSSTHIFAAQTEKAVVHVYSREHGNQEATVAFPERIRCLTLVHDGLLVLGTAEGRIILWEVCTGRQISTLASHLQPVTCVSATSRHLATGSEDANIHIWSVSRLLSWASTEVHQPLRSLSDHKGAVTSVAMGCSTSTANICVSASRDGACIVWNYHSGQLLRTFLLPSVPLCVAMDPCDRAVYLGFEDGSIRSVELFQTKSMLNSLYDIDLQSTPIQAGSNPFSGSPPEVGAVNCLGLSYDGTLLLSGHATGKIFKWETGPQTFSAELIDLNAPVTNITMLSPFSEHRTIRAGAVIKPRLGKGNYTFTGQFMSQLSKNDFQDAVASPGIPSHFLNSAILELSGPAAPSAAPSSGADEKLRKENDDLWVIVNEQRELQKRTYEKYIGAKSGR